MSPEQWRQVENLYHAARDQSSDERMRMLAAAEPEVRREVESLLDQPQNGPLSHPVQEWPGAVSASNSAAPPSTIAHYRITGKIGEGGMGAVYRATDTRLGREVAIKFLLPSLAGDSDYMSRFQREAKVLASLNHPNIAVVHGLEESNAAQALVMELVEGPTLAARIAQGAIPLKEALPIAQQIAEALEAAHEKGVVHRDLKPGNVKVKPDGAVKVLDFGLAKACATPSALGEDSSTLSMGMAEAGKVLGTAPYMSPEQASGKPVDKRSDIWAFGVVLWEMLTGKRLFSGATMPDTLTQVLTAPIDLDRLPKDTPTAIRNLVRRCLERDARNRLRDIGEARITLQACLAGSAEPAAAERAADGAKRSGLIWTLAVGLALCAAIAGWALWPKPRRPVVTTRFQIPLPKGVTSVPHVLLSPDGRKLLISTSQSLWVRDFDGLEWRYLSDTNGALGPFWSPDSKFVAFGIRNQLEKIDISGGPPQVLCTVQNTVASGDWNRDGKIVFGSAGRGPLYRVSDGGGIATEVTNVDSSRGEVSHTLPSFLPDGKRFVYFRQGPAEVRGIYAGSIDAKPGEQPRKPIFLSPFAASYAGGYLFFMRGNTLMAQRFDSGRLELKGEPFVAADHVDINQSRVDGVSSVPSSGILAYRGFDHPTQFQFTWFDRQGKSWVAFGEPISAWGLVLSPDGARAVFRDNDSQHPGDLWSIDFARGTRTRLTFRQSVIRTVVWSSDGSRVIFAAGPAAYGGATDALYEKASSGAGDEKELFKQAGANMVPDSWSRDGRFLLYHNTGGDDLWVLPLEGDRRAVPLLTEKFNERAGSFSPDGRWIAYKSDETGRWEIYVRPFLVGPSGAPSLGGGKWQISRDGAAHDGDDLKVGFPQWRADGKEIFFGAPNGAVMSVEVSPSGGNFQPGVPKQLLTLSPAAGGWDVTPDGKKFLVPVAQTAQASLAPITVVLNWRAELGR